MDSQLESQVDFSGQASPIFMGRIHLRGIDPCIESTRIRNPKESMAWWVLCKDMDFVSGFPDQNLGPVFPSKWATDFDTADICG